MLAQRLTALPNPAHSPHLRRFGQFELDLRTAEIYKEGKRIKLQDQPCQVLAPLIPLDRAAKQRNRITRSRDTGPCPCPVGGATKNYSGQSPPLPGNRSRS